MASNLYEKLKSAQSEEDVKDIYIKALDEVSTHIGMHFVSYNLEFHSEEFVEVVKTAIFKGDIIRAGITPNNLKQVFDKWVHMIGREVNGVDESNYALLFFADIMHDGTFSTHKNLPAELLYKNNEPVFMLDGKIYALGSKEGYGRFWAIHHRPPAQEYRNYLLERRDSLIAIDERSFKGVYYTPLHVVDKAIGGMICKGSDMQHASKQTALLSSGYCSAGGFIVTENNLGLSCGWGVRIARLGGRDKYPHADQAFHTVNLH